MLFCALVCGTSNLIERWSRALRVVGVVVPTLQNKLLPFWTRTGDIRGRMDPYGDVSNMGSGHETKCCAAFKRPWLRRIGIASRNASPTPRQV